jgi:hypothetical protein
MGRPVPFIFCRYTMHVDDELLDADGAFQALSEVQGKFLPHGKKAEREGLNSVVVMQPSKVSVGDEDVVTWKIGNRPGYRNVTDYDASGQTITNQIEDDRHIVYSEIVALPRLGVMAVNDRINAMHMGAQPALSRTRSAFRQIDGGTFAYWFLQPGDVELILEDLDLAEYAYTIRRINPTPPSVLAAALDASMQSEGIGIQRGVAKPMPGETMHSENGFIRASSDFVEAGYGVLGFKGTTSGGHQAQIRKPTFSLDKKENLKQQQKETPLRVFIESSDSDDDLTSSIVSELVRFYG